MRGSLLSAGDLAWRAAESHCARGCHALLPRNPTRTPSRVVPSRPQLQRLDALSRGIRDAVARIVCLVHRRASLPCGMIAVPRHQVLGIVLVPPLNCKGTVNVTNIFKFIGKTEFRQNYFISRNLFLELQLVNSKKPLAGSCLLQIAYGARGKQSAAHRLRKFFF